MLYDPSSSLSRDEQSSSESGRILTEQLSSLSTAAPSARLADKQRLLHFMQEKHYRLPHLLVRYGKDLLQHASRALGSGVWDLYEKVVMAALDAHDSTTATWALTKLDKQWPNSQRVQKLKAMRKEAQGEWEEAAEIYHEMLESDPVNASALKRLVCVSKAQGKVAEALMALNRYVANYSSDEAAWMEMSELYVQTQQYELAAYAAEELLLLAPENYTYHLRYAELCYTLGRMDNARQYYAQSLELKPYNNLRALHGLQLTLKQKNGSSGAVDAAQLYSWTVEQLLAHYKKYCSKELNEVLNTTLKGENAVAASATAKITSSAASSSAASTTSSSASSTDASAISSTTTPSSTDNTASPSTSLTSESDQVD